MNVYTGVIILCVVVIALQISRRHPLSQQASLAVGVVLIMAGVGIWASIRERSYERMVEKHMRKPKARKS